MDDPFLQRMRIYLHLVPVFGVVPSLWTLYSSGNSPGNSLGNSRETSREASCEVSCESYGEDRDASEEIGSARLKSASQLSVLIGLGSISAIALLGAAASTQPTQLVALRFLISASFVGSGYFLLSLALMFRVAKGQSIRLSGLTPLSRRLP